MESRRKLKGYGKSMVSASSQTKQAYNRPPVSRGMTVESNPRPIVVAVLDTGIEFDSSRVCAENWFAR